MHVLLRPRPGNFVYSDAEFQMLLDDLEHAADLGVAGFVAGVLTANQTVDEQRMRELVRLAGRKEVTFHRAFDQTGIMRRSFGANYRLRMPTVADFRR